VCLTVVIDNPYASTVWAELYEVAFGRASDLQLLRLLDFLIVYALNHEASSLEHCRGDECCYTWYGVVVVACYSRVKSGRRGQ